MYSNHLFYILFYHLVAVYFFQATTAILKTVDWNKIIKYFQPEDSPQGQASNNQEALQDTNLLADKSIGFFFIQCENFEDSLRCVLKGIVQGPDHQNKRKYYFFTSILMANTIVNR